MSEGTDSSWGRVASSIGSGELYLDVGVAQRCAQRCAEFITHLKAIQTDTAFLAKMDGFGDLLPSGVALAAKFEKKAAGGDYSMDRAIGDHIAVVQEMKQVFEKIEAMYASSEERGTAGIGSAGAPLDR